MCFYHLPVDSELHVSVTYHQHLKQVILDQTGQNKYQTVVVDVYIFDLVFICLLEYMYKCCENSLVTIVILPLISIGNL